MASSKLKVWLLVLCTLPLLQSGTALSFDGIGDLDELISAADMEIYSDAVHFHGELAAQDDDWSAERDLLPQGSTHNEVMSFLQLIDESVPPALEKEDCDGEEMSDILDRDMDMSEFHFISDLADTEDSLDKLQSESTALLQEGDAMSTDEEMEKPGDDGYSPLESKMDNAGNIDDISYINSQLHESEPTKGILKERSHERRLAKELAKSMPDATKEERQSALDADLQAEAMSNTVDNADHFVTKVKAVTNAKSDNNEKLDKESDVDRFSHPAEATDN